jgi:hypothetical protein
MISLNFALYLSFNNGGGGGSASLTSDIKRFLAFALSVYAKILYVLKIDKLFLHFYSYSKQSVKK